MFGLFNGTKNKPFCYWTTSNLIAPIQSNEASLQKSALGMILQTTPLRSLSAAFCVSMSLFPSITTQGTKVCAGFSASVAAPKVCNRALPTGPYRNLYVLFGLFQVREHFFTLAHLSMSSNIFPRQSLAALSARPNPDSMQITAGMYNAGRNLNALIVQASSKLPLK